MIKQKYDSDKIFFKKTYFLHFVSLLQIIYDSLHRAHAIEK